VKSRTTILVSLATTLALVASSVPAVRAQDADAVPMSLSECLTQALENNLDLAIAKKDPEIAWNDVLFQKAAFDPVFGSNAKYTQDKQDVQTLFQPTPTGTQTVFVAPTYKTIEISATLASRFNFGGTLDAVLWSNRTDSVPAYARQYSPSYASYLALRFTLPLLKGFGREVNEYQILVAKQNLSISHEELRRKAVDTIRTVEDGYWDLRAAREAQKVAEQALKLAQDLYELNKKKVEVGTLAPIEITQAEANVASNVEGVITSKATVQNAEDALRRLLAVPSGDPLWGRTINPTEQPAATATTIDRDEAIDTALKERPELIQSRMQLQTAELSERVAKKEAWHQLDLVTSLTPTGNNLIETVELPGPDGIPNTFDDETQFITGGAGQGLKEIPQFNVYNWSVELIYKIPIGNRAARANYASATIAKEKAMLSERNTEELVRVDVRRAVRAVESGYERVAAARKNVELQQKKLDAEQKKFDNGMSTSFEVFTFQTDLRNAQLSLIRALLDYNKALADLERAKGTLLESKGLKLADNTGR